VSWRGTLGPRLDPLSAYSFLPGTAADRSLLKRLDIIFLFCVLVRRMSSTDTADWAFTGLLQSLSGGRNAVVSSFKARGCN